MLKRHSTQYRDGIPGSAQRHGGRPPNGAYCDSAAAIGIASRSGLGKFWHLQVHFLWVQEDVRNKSFRLSLALGSNNTSDVSVLRVVRDGNKDTRIPIWECASNIEMCQQAHPPSLFTNCAWMLVTTALKTATGCHHTILVLRPLRHTSCTDS